MSESLAPPRAVYGRRLAELVERWPGCWLDERDGGRPVIHAPAPFRGVIEAILEAYEAGFTAGDAWSRCEVRR